MLVYPVLYVQKNWLAKGYMDLDGSQFVSTAALSSCCNEFCDLFSKMMRKVMIPMTRVAAASVAGRVQVAAFHGAKAVSSNFHPLAMVSFNATIFNCPFNKDFVHHF